MINNTIEKLLKNKWRKRREERMKKQKGQKILFSGYQLNFPGAVKNMEDKWLEFSWPSLKSICKRLNTTKYSKFQKILHNFGSMKELVKDEKGDLVADSHRILARWRNYFSQLLNVHRVNDVWQPKTYAVKLLTPESSAF